MNEQYGINYYNISEIENKALNEGIVSEKEMIFLNRITTIGERNLSLLSKKDRIKRKYILKRLNKLCYDI
ncbi:MULTISPECIES: hypothetical protein [Bacillus amyloliquefaciens group]|uniref:hypothetical protein n=1 Tax=Bacillus amyloliquefaciens group TaxID=1938374 RepID=UPI001ABE503F|nr:MULTISPECIES: hypothetical protein [Bacillus amyloliquefaciens group]MCP9020083.1 hypothetical protein [Bacillus velezensis]QTG83506.1 hypothetical protein J4048_11025 [Bacillus amyloliquefaciens]